ncbi:hypothetical protein [Acinetobacter piscicola]|uniref:hypothetical protein n=1 Tax=Acinetobacter piscicola TaxID=2006115 RepID=UPI0010227993|nr:hypothetical protein [Acinetobacter piscicola]RYL25094.1 hypothetical protein EWP19_13005 [Acinetobacter piscicola]
MTFKDWFLDKFKCTDDERFDSCEDAWNAAMQSRQAEVDDLQLELSRAKHVYNNVVEMELKKNQEKDKRIEAAIAELESLHDQKWAEWKEQADMHSQGEANAYEHAMQILEKALRGGDQNYKKCNQVIESNVNIGGDQKGGGNDA